jgi:hypothetical protein
MLPMPEAIRRLITRLFRRDIFLLAVIIAIYRRFCFHYDTAPTRRRRDACSVIQSRHATRSYSPTRFTELFRYAMLSQPVRRFIAAASWLSLFAALCFHTIMLGAPALLCERRYAAGWLFIFSAYQPSLRITVARCRYCALSHITVYGWYAMPPEMRLPSCRCALRHISRMLRFSQPSRHILQSARYHAMPLRIFPCWLERRSERLYCRRCCHGWRYVVAACHASLNSITTFNILREICRHYAAFAPHAAVAENIFMRPEPYVFQLHYWRHRYYARVRRLSLCLSIYAAPHITPRRHRRLVFCRLPPKPLARQPPPRH